jgi:hypothetical protein
MVKYHFELNPAELAWSHCKRKLRSLLSGKLESLRWHLETWYSDITSAVVTRWTDHTMRYLNGYRSGKSTAEVFKEIRQRSRARLTSHARGSAAGSIVDISEPAAGAGTSSGASTSSSPAAGTRPAHVTKDCCDVAFAPA